MSPSRGTAQRSVRIPPELWDLAQAVAKSRGETVSDVVRRSLESYVEEGT